MRRSVSFYLARQGGAAGLAIVVLLLLLMGGMITSTFILNGRVVEDAIINDQRAQALFLAESGMERAAYRYLAGSMVCGTLAETMSNVFSSGASFTVGAGDSFNFDGVTPLGAGLCRLRSTGTTASGSVRIVEAILRSLPVTSSSSALQDTTSGNFNVDSGTELLLVTTAWRSNKPVISTVTSATYNGVALTPVSSDYSYPAVPSCSTGICDPLRASAQMFYMINPPAGSHPLVFTLPNAPDVFVKIAFNLSGVDLSAPIDHFGGGSGLSPASGTAFGASITTTKPNDFIIDLIGREKTGNMDPAGCPLRSVLYNNNATNKIGAVSRCGPIANAGPVAMNWIWNQPNKPWATAVVAIKSVAGGMIGWREVSVAPP